MARNKKRKGTKEEDRDGKLGKKYASRKRFVSLGVKSVLASF